MTAPTPQQMRALADTQEHAADIDRNAVRSSLLRDSAAALRAAANRLENQQDWLDHSHPVDIDDLAKQMIDSVGEEADRLRAVIENAPHARNCHTTRGYGCSCWKADVL